MAVIMQKSVKNPVTYKSVLQIASTVALVEFETSLREPLNAL